MQLTSEQSAAISAEGKVIVSASAGSGKTFVMIEKLAQSVLNGVDLDDVLCVTFTKKAASQMKEKLRAAIIKKLETASAEEKVRLKSQLSKIGSANISTIHAFCAKLLRTYFYVLDIDSGFDIISSDDATARDLKNRVLDSVFERGYASDDADFKHLLDCFWRKRSDAALRKTVDEAYGKVRGVARYQKMLENCAALYTDEGFDEVCRELSKIRKNAFDRLICAVERFKSQFFVTNKREGFDKIFDEMIAALTISRDGKLFDAKPTLTVSRKPSVGEDDLEADEAFKAFRKQIKKQYDDLHDEYQDRENQKNIFIKSGVTAAAFSRLILAFDAEYAAVKREENRLDYNDLEHLTLKLLENGEIRREIADGFKYAYVDEYQDVNPVQEEIISALTSDSFVVGDVKQAIYGFRGSKSKFFADKFKSYESGTGGALRLSNNFRSSDAVLEFVNALFSDIMTEESCGIDYKNKSQMLRGGLYPEGYGYAQIHVVGAQEKPQDVQLDVYSVKNDCRKTTLTPEGLAVLSIVKRELASTHFDLNARAQVNTRPGDICILTRKNKGYSVDGIVRALASEGYAVSGAQETNICALPEVKQMLDILSLIDNAEQDIPLVTALLSPVGGFTENELALIRVNVDKSKTSIKKSFRQCCKEYSALPGVIPDKLKAFYKKLAALRDLAEILPTGELVDELLENYGVESCYGADGERKVKNVLRLAEEGATLPLAAFLEKIKTGGYEISMPQAADSDSIKIMSMHASKGLEFPVVILADISRRFTGVEYCEMPFDEKYGFAPRLYDKQTMRVCDTILRRLVKLRENAEDLKNEYNLFYVACTRAMCNLHLLTSEQKQFDELSKDSAKCYADLFDMQKFNPRPIALYEAQQQKTGASAFIYKPDQALINSIEQKFNWKYAYTQSIDLPLKSSASAILKMNGSEQEPHYRVNEMFKSEYDGSTSIERGTVYHRFLELCDFTAKSTGGVSAQLQKFLAEGKISERQFELLNADELVEILNMPVFENVRAFKLLREQEFLCRLKACEVLKTDADDFVLLQGAIDLLAISDGQIKIIDYKYSHKSDSELVSTYAKQLDLYKKVVSKVLKMPESKIATTIVNICLRRQIDL